MDPPAAAPAPPPPPPPLPPNPVVIQPEPIPQPPGLLRMRGENLLHHENVMVTTCPQSMELYIYLQGRCQSKLLRNLEFERITITDEEEPGFALEHQLFANVEALDDDDLVSLGPLPNSVEIEDKKMRLTESLNDIRDCYLFGYRLLCNPDTQYVNAAADTIRENVNLDIDEQIEELLLNKMEAACAVLTQELGDNTYFLDSLRETLDNNTSKRSMQALSLLDVKQAASTILIMKCFKSEHASAYHQGIYDILHRHISIWAHAEIVYSWFVQQRPQVTDYTETLEGNAAMLNTELNEAAESHSGGQGTVYKITLFDGNLWGLDMGEYAFKLSTPRSCEDIACEGINLAATPYECICKVVGWGAVKRNESKMHLLILKWYPGRDLKSRMDSFNWSQVKSATQEIAYALHLVHKTCDTCVVDLKPHNIMLDENDRIILCDFGLAEGHGASSGGLAGTPFYNDGDKEICKEGDVFCYGMTLIELLTDKVEFDNQFGVNKDTNGRNLAKRIRGYIESGGSLRDLMKRRLVEDDAFNQEEDKVAVMLLLTAVRCIDIDKKKRPTTLDLLVSFGRLLGI